MDDVKNYHDQPGDHSASLAVCVHIGTPVLHGITRSGSCNIGLAAALPPYDGMWSVSVVTEQGLCNDGFKYSIHIKDSALSNGGDAPVVISGTVTGRGITQRGDRSRIQQRYRIGAIVSQQWPREVEGCGWSVIGLLSQDPSQYQAASPGSDHVEAHSR